jgi:hypothetical protein
MSGFVSHKKSVDRVCPLTVVFQSNRTRLKIESIRPKGAQVKGVDSGGNQRGKADAASLISSETCSWGWGRYEGRDWLVDWRPEDLREEEIPKVAWTIVCNSQMVGSKLGAKKVFQVRESRISLGQE